MNKTILSIGALSLALFLTSCAKEEDSWPEDRGQALSVPAVQKDGFDLEAVRRIPLLAEQRYVPFDTKARNLVRRVTGKEKFNKTDPMLVMLHWMLEPEKALNEAWIQLPKRATAELLELPIRTKERQHVSLQFLWQERAGWANKVEELRQRNADGEKLGLVEIDAVQVESQVGTLMAVAGIEVRRSGSEAELFIPEKRWQGKFRAIPPSNQPVPGQLYDWIDPKHAVVGTETPEQKGKAEPWQPAAFAPVQAVLDRMAAAWDADDGAAFAAAAVDFQKTTEALGYPRPLEGLPLNDPKNKLAFRGMDLMDREVTLNAMNPFVSTKYIYFLAVFVFAFTVPFRGMTRRIGLFLGLLVMLGAGGMHIWGLVERTAISNRAMIGNLYESLIFATAGAVVLCFIGELIHRKGWLGLIGSISAFIGLFGAASDPTFMSPEIQNLQPVLINNDLIHIHVPTIMLSYAALAIPAIVAHIWLACWWFMRRPAGGVQRSRVAAQHGAWFSEKARHPLLQVLSLIMLWFVPVGIILLFVGIILGGVWADMSWGRFWGWDPKETSSLILWLWFVAVVHGRWAGWLRDVGVALGNVVGGVLMMWTWFGTNLFLGGLHSYGGTSGTEINVPTWVVIYGSIEAAFIAISLAVLYFRRTDEALVQRSPGGEGGAGGAAEPAQGSA